MVVGTDRDRKTGALRALLAHNDNAGLNYAGAAFIALNGDERKKFLAEVERLTTSWSALKSSRATDVKWCQPRLAVRVKHLAGSKMLRNATVKELLPWAFGFWCRLTSLLDFHCQSGLTDRFAVSERRLFEGVPLLRDLRGPFRIPRYQDGVAHSLPRTLRSPPRSGFPCADCPETV